MKTELFMEYLPVLMIMIGIAAFLVSVITQVIKDIPLLNRIHTNIVVLVTSLIICPVLVIIFCIYSRIKIYWYIIFASVMGAFIVYLVATGGWERINRIWKRTRYKDR